MIKYYLFQFNLKWHIWLDICFDSFKIKAKHSSIQTDLENRLSEKESELDQAITSNKEAVAEAYERERVSQDKLSDINKQLDYALSAKLELEAKVESTSDEMR